MNILEAAVYFTVGHTLLNLPNKASSKNHTGYDKKSYNTNMLNIMSS